MCFLQLVVCILCFPTCVFYVSQSELRHLQCTISVSVCSRVINQLLVLFSRWLCYSSRQLQCMVSVCVCAHDLEWIGKFGEFFRVNSFINSSLVCFFFPRMNCAVEVSLDGLCLVTARCVHFMVPKMDCAINRVQSVYVCARIWPRVNCKISASFFRCTVLFTVRCFFGASQKKWIAPPTVHSACACVCVSHLNRCIWCFFFHSFLASD